VRRRLGIKLEIVNRGGSASLEIGKHPTEPGVGRDPTDEDYALASACMLLLCGVAVDEKSRALLVSAIDKASASKAAPKKEVA
jgi:hypothetical protein